MQKRINEWGKEVWDGIELDTPFSEDFFHEVTKYNNDENYQLAFHSNLGSITVLERTTGYGWKDNETGYRDPLGNFWLASGHRNVISAMKNKENPTVDDAIQYVKKYANTCIPRDIDEN